MKNITRNCCLALLASLMTLPAIAQMNGTGYYRVRNYQYNNYISIANDRLVYKTIVSSGGGATKLALQTSTYAPYAFNCVDAYLRNDIHLNPSEYIDPATVIYAKKIESNDYNLIGQGTSLLTLTTGMYDGTNGDVLFSDLNVSIIKKSGSGASSLYTASILLKATATGIPLFGTITKELGTRYFVDNNGTFSISESTPDNAMWYVEPLTYFNVNPEVEFNGKYYTTLKVPFECKLDPDNSDVKKAYVIESVSDGVVQPVEIADNIPAGTPMVLECSSNNPLNCKLFFISNTTMPVFPAPVGTATSAPTADEDSYYGGTNLLKGTYYCNDDANLEYVNYQDTTLNLSTANRHVTSATDPQKYVLGITESGKLGFIPASGNMPINKAWLESAGEFPWELPVTVKLGDVNDDGVVTIKDVTCLIDYLLGGEPEPFNLDNADVSEDGAVTIKDVTALIDLLLSNPDE